MRAVCIFDRADKRPKRVNKTTAYYIFDRDSLYSFSVDAASFRARNNALHLPVVSVGGIEDLTRIAQELIYTAGTIWDMVLYFNDGARLALDSPADAKSIYRRIVEHLEAHLNAMRTDITYTPPNSDDFRMMAEFATTIRYQAVSEDPNLDERVDNSFFANMSARPTFSKDDLHDVRSDDTPKVPKSVEKMDAIERFLEMIGYS